MNNLAEDHFIFALSKLLTGNRVETETIEKSLKLICNDSLSVCGLIYEADFAAQLHLMERYDPSGSSYPESLAASEFTSEIIMSLAQKPIHIVNRSEQNTVRETELLDTYGTDLLILSPITDENYQLYGMIVLLGSAEPESEILSASLSMLAHYVAIRMYQKKLRNSQETLENILDNTGIDIYVNDFYSHEILYVNESMAAPYGGKDQLLKKKCWQALFPGQTGPCEFCPQKKIIDENGNPTRVYSWDYQRPFDGSWFRVFSSAYYWGDGRLAHVVSSADNTENKQNEALIENLANYDQLTKLPNRRMLIRECERRINKATSTEQGYLLFFDIDGFKNINDTFGHDAGDEFLIQLGAFFSSIPLLKDAIYRNGGDEFVAIVGGESVSKENIRSLASFIHQRFKKPWKLQKGDIYCNTSIGVACYPEDGLTVEPLLQKSDMAMYKAKKSGGASICFGYEL